MAPLRARPVAPLLAALVAAAACAAALAPLPRAAAARACVKLDMPPRVQWQDNDGYCGETSVQMAALYYGAYVSQYVARAAGGGTQEVSFLQSEGEAGGGGGRAEKRGGWSGGGRCCCRRAEQRLCEAARPRHRCRRRAAEGAAESLCAEPF